MVNTHIDFNLDGIKSKLKATLSLKRYEHSINVMDTCVILADFYNCNKQKAIIAGLLHDCAREIKGEAALALCKESAIKPDRLQVIQTDLLHGALGVIVANKDYKINDKEILSAIKWHTTGHKNMTLLEKIVLIADYIEPGREFKGVDILRKLVMKDLEGAIIAAMDITIEYVLKKGMLLHPQTIQARNYLIIKKGIT